MNPSQKKYSGLIFPGRVNFSGRTLRLAVWLVWGFLSLTGFASDAGTFCSPDTQCALYLNPHTGRFWTMDTEEGSGDDPLSLHKYLYCNVNPQNHIDPSGHGDGDVATFSVSANLAAGLGALSMAVILEAKAHAIGNLMAAAWTETMTDAGSIEDAAESALSVARTSVRDLLKQATDILKQTGRGMQRIKIIPMPRSIIPNVANHVAVAQASGQPMILTRVTPAVAVANRRAATASLGSAGTGKTWDEYPFASGKNPLTPMPVSVVAVPWLENSIQGGIISACYKIENITVGTPFVVVVTP
jgi:hypothetical protein